VIEAIAAAAVADGRVPAPQRRRLMSLPLITRLTVAMTLMPDAGCARAARQVAGHLADVPWARDWHVPASKVFTKWRDKAGPAPLEELFWPVAGPLIGDDAPSAVNLAGMAVCGIDGMLVAVADTPGERGGVRVRGHQHQEGLRAGAIPADRSGGGDRAGGPRQARRGHGGGPGRGADAAGPPHRPPAGAVRRAGVLLRPQLPRP
jgi:Insertion element 4 transposase N-terminal